MNCVEVKQYPFGSRGDRLPKADAGAADLSAASTTTMNSPQKPNQPQLQHEDSDDATTAYSSWMEDNSSQISSACLTCRSSRDDDDDDISCPQTIISRSSIGSPRFACSTDDDGDDGDALVRHLSLSSSYYSAMENQQDSSELDVDSGRSEFHFELDPDVVVDHSKSCQNDFLFELDLDLVVAHAEPWRHCSKGMQVTPAASQSLEESDALSELTERAHHMLQREQSGHYDINKYFHVEKAVDASPSRRSVSPIDANCRSKMMEWSFRVVAFSFPHQVQQQHCKRQREYSIQTIQIVSQAFNLIDRIATLHFNQGNDNQPMDRSDYKLTCMVCLHLSAKTCGLFGLYESKSDCFMEEEQYSPLCGDEVSMPRQEADSDPSRKDKRWKVDETDSCGYTSSWSLSSSMASHGPRDDGSDIVSPQTSEEGQTILPTPEGSHTKPAHESGCKDSTSKPPRQRTVRRPPLNLVSLPGLASLCQDEYSIQQLVQMEWKVLQKLNWNMAGHTSVDWCNLLLDMLTVRLGMLGNNNVDPGKIQGVALTNLETVMQANRLLTPSIVACAAVEHALDYCTEYEHGRHCVILAYKEMVSDLFPHGEEEVDAVRLCF